MTIPVLGLDHMANSQRTYQWVNGRIQDVGSMHAIEPKEAVARPPRRAKKAGPGIDLQTALFVFTCSSVVMIFAGAALIVVLFVIYSVVFG
jgi:hypothetical protein